MLVSLGVTVGCGSQLSVAVNTAAAGTALHSTVSLAGAALRTGAVVSCTVMTCVLVELLLQASRAVQVRVIV